MSFGGSGYGYESRESVYKFGSEIVVSFLLEIYRLLSKSRLLCVVRFVYDSFSFGESPDSRLSSFELLLLVMTI